MKVRAVTINDESLLSPAKKTELENLLLATMAKAQTKAQEVVQEKTKEIL
jgi:DNA-binding protein YbaB